MRKVLLALVIVIVVGIAALFSVSFSRLGRLSGDVISTFEKVSAFYEKLADENANSLLRRNDLPQEIRGNIEAYQKHMVTLEQDKDIHNRIDALRAAQKTAFTMFASATGAVATDIHFQAWRRDASMNGHAEPLLLEYNRAASIFNVVASRGFNRFVALVFHWKPYHLIDLKGDPYKEEPSYI